MLLWISDVGKSVPLVLSHLRFFLSQPPFSCVSSSNPDQRTCDNHRESTTSPLWQRFGIAGHKLALSLAASPAPPHPGLFCLLLQVFFHFQQHMNTVTGRQQCPIGRHSTLPHTVLPGSGTARHHPSARLYSQRKSPFPGAITLGTPGSGLKCDLWARAGTGSTVGVCAAAKSNTYG